MSAPDSHQNTRNLKLDLDLLNKAITEHLTNNGDIFVVQNLNQVVLAAGFIRFTRAIEFFDERVEKKGSTDVKRDWVPHELLEAYRRNAVCERLWRQTKCKRMFLERFFLKNEWRLEALLCLVQIACLAQVLMENKIRQGQAEHRVWIPDPEHKELETKSTYRRTSNYFKDNGPKVVYYNDGTATVTGVDQTILSVLACLGNEWLELILSDRYRIHIDSLPRMRLPIISVL